jgi:ribonucleoside-diphosphate reductase alpha chain
MLDQLKRAEGSVQEIAEITEEMRLLYRTSWELPQKALIDLAVARGPFIDQSQSLNLFVESPNIGKLSSMYMYAWKAGLKTTYYLRSRPATRITKTTVDEGSPVEAAIESIAPSLSEAEALACSLENPEHCEACE